MNFWIEEKFSHCHHLKVVASNGLNYIRGDTHVCNSIGRRAGRAVCSALHQPPPTGVSMSYIAAEARYSGMRYNRCGRSGVKLPAISLGLWHNFGGVDAFENGRAIVRRAFDLGITHFDLANNY